MVIDTTNPGDSKKTETTTTTTVTTADREGNKLLVDTRTTKQSIGQFVSDVTMNPYMLTDIISFYAYNMRPNTRLHIFFDSVNVDQHCAPAKRDASNNYQRSVTNTADYRSVQRGNTFGTAIYSDKDGFVAGQFKVPAKTFRTGDRMMQITDVDDLVLGNTAFTTLASARYSSSNLTVTKKEITLTTVNPEFSYAPLKETKVSSNTSQTVVITKIKDILDVTMFFEPIAQSLTINTGGSETGIFATSIDLFFKKKPDANTVGPGNPIPGITVYLCEMLNGYPNGNAILPFSTTHLEANSVNVSNNSSLATTFTFEAPVFMNNNKEYAFIVRPDNNNQDYYVWSANLGDKDVSTGAQVSSQPVTGTAFYGATMTQWTALPTEYIKFNLRRAKFSNNAGDAYFTNADTDYMQIGDISYNVSGGSIDPGDKVFGVTTSLNVYANTAGFSNTADSITISSANSILSANDKIYYGVPSGNTPIQGLTGNTFYYVKTSNTTAITLSSNVGGTTINITDNRTTNPAETHTIIPLIPNTSMMGTLEYYDNVRNVIYVANSTGNFTTNTFIQIHQFPNEDAVTNPGPNNTTLVAYTLLNDIYNPVLNALVPGFSFITPSGTALGYSYRGASNTYNLEQNENIVTIGTETSFVDQERIVASKTNEVNLNGGEKTMSMHVKLATDSEYTSPAIDMIQLNQQIISNNIDSIEFNYEEFYTYGASKSKYISKVVTLAEGQDAEDMQVILSAHRPVGTDIKVYVKFLNADDSESMSQKTWTPMLNSTQSLYTSDNPSDFKEFVYKTPVIYSMIPTDGFVTTTNTSNVVTGTDTSFLTDFKEGWYVNMRYGTNGGEFSRQITSISNNTHMTLNSPFVWDHTGEAIFLVPPPTTAWLGKNSSVQLTGNVQVYTTNTAVVGTGTSFTTELLPNDVININGDVQKVVSITNSTFMSVETVWSANNSALKAYRLTNDGITYLNSNNNLYSSFKQFQVKIVLQSSDTSKVPLLDDLRALALQL